MQGKAADDALVFADRDGMPFHAASLYRRADRAWSKAGLSGRLRLHQARHTYAPLMIAAGINAKALSVFMAIPRQGHVRSLPAPDAGHGG